MYLSFCIPSVFLLEAFISNVALGVQSCYLSLKQSNAECRAGKKKGWTGKGSKEKGQEKKERA